MAYDPAYQIKPTGPVPEKPLMLPQSASHPGGQLLDILSEVFNALPTIPPQGGSAGGALAVMIPQMILHAFARRRLRGNVLDALETAQFNKGEQERATEREKLAGVSEAGRQLATYRHSLKMQEIAARPVRSPVVKPPPLVSVVGPSGARTLQPKVAGMELAPAKPPKPPKPEKAPPARVQTMALDRASVGIDNELIAMRGKLYGLQLKGASQDSLMPYINRIANLRIQRLDAREKALALVLRKNGATPDTTAALKDVQVRRLIIRRFNEAKTLQALHGIKDIPEQYRNDPELTQAFKERESALSR